MTDAGPVAVVTEVDDVTADMVITELNKRDVPVVRFDLSDIGDGLLLSARFGACPASPAGHLRTPSRTTTLEGVRSVYWRRPAWPQFENLEDPDARFTAAQVRHGLGGTLYALPNCRYVNHPLHNYGAEHKPLQLAVAERLGLTVPPTLISNDLDLIRAFIAERGQVVYKALRWTPYRRSDGVGLTTWTEPVTASEVDESVTVVPHLFQARVWPTPTYPAPPARRPSAGTPSTRPAGGRPAPRRSRSPGGSSRGPTTPGAHGRSVTQTGGTRKAEMPPSTTPLTALLTRRTLSS